ncbi:MAG: ATP-binding protein [Methanomicrobiales archaeon]|nr:ATP-binding protein [Methanomicrobiales archaeon]
MFLNRFDELHSLQERFDSANAELVIFYGRRRVGKSELIDQFIQKNSGIRILAREETKELQLKQTSSDLTSFFGDIHLGSVIFPEWDAVFTYIRSYANKRIIIALDEFPYLVKEDPSLLSIIQYHWDTWMKDSRIFLILCGSSISMMEDLTMRYESPLFGRRTGQYLIKPLRFVDILDYTADFKIAVELFAVFGGIPAYIFKADIRNTIFDNIITKILTEDSILFRDTEFVLRSEVSEPRYYFSILRSIAEGITVPSKISQVTGLERATVSKYLQVLMDLQIIVRIIPAGEPSKSKKGQYFLSDNYFAFWFRYVYPFTKTIEMGNGRVLCDQHIKPTLPAYIGMKFEDCVRDLLWEFNSNDVLPFIFYHCSRWWMKDTEIDLVAYSDTAVMFCEMKWQDDVNPVKIYADLVRKSELFLSSHQGYTERYYLIVAKSFTRKKPGINDSVLTWDSKTLLTMHRKVKTGRKKG